MLSLRQVYWDSSRKWVLDSVEASSIIRKSKWKHPVEECINNNAVIHANDAKLFSKAKVSSPHGECWLLVFCFTYLPITKRIILTKFLISYFSDSHLACSPLFQFSPLPPAVETPSSSNKVVSSINTSAFLPVYSHYLWQNPHCSCFLYRFSKNEYQSYCPFLT